MFVRTRYRRKSIPVPALFELATESMRFRSLHPHDGRYRQDREDTQSSLDRMITITMPRIGTATERLINWKTMGDYYANP